MLCSAIAVATAACTGGTGSAPTWTYAVAAPAASPVRSSGDSANPASPSGAASQTVTLVLKEYSITPATVTVRAGIPVNFVVQNGGTISHALVIGGSGVNLATKDLAFQPGISESISGTLSPGSYTFICPVDGHAGLGMRGTITVTP